MQSINTNFVPIMKDVTTKEDGVEIMFLHDTFNPLCNIKCSRMPRLRVLMYSQMQIREEKDFIVSWVKIRNDHFVCNRRSLNCVYSCDEKLHHCKHDSRTYPLDTA